MDRRDLIETLDRDVCVKKMEELQTYTTKFIKIEFNKKHKINQEIQHFLGLEGPIKDCLDDLLNKTNKLEKTVIFALNHVEVELVLCVDYA